MRRTTVKTDAARPTGRTTTRPAILKFPRKARPVCRPSFPCPLCGGEATVTGRGDRRELCCLDCTAFTTRTDD